MRNREYEETRLSDITVEEASDLLTWSLVKAWIIIFLIVAIFSFLLGAIGFFAFSNTAMDIIMSKI